MITEVEFEQFLLISSMDKLKLQEKKYENLIVMTGDKPEFVFNKIMNCDKDVYNFWANLSPLQKAALVPRINLFYWHIDKKKYIPIMFRNSPNFEFIKKFASSRADETELFKNQKEDGAGIKQVTIINKNEKPSDVNIEVKIELFFDNEIALYNSNLLELIKTPKTRSYNQSIDYRIKLVTGWATPVDFTKKIFSQKDLDIIEKSNSVYLLEIVTHDIQISDNGSLKLTIHYQGALEKYLNISSASDIFSLNSEDYKRLYATQFLEKDNVETFDILTTDRKNTGKIVYNKGNGPEWQGDVVGKTYIYDKEDSKFYIAANIERISLETQIAALSKKEGDLTETRFIDEDKKNEKQKNNDKKIKELEEKLQKINDLINGMEMFIRRDKYSKLLKKIIEDKRLNILMTEAEELEKIFQLFKDGKIDSYDTLKSIKVYSHNNLNNINIDTEKILKQNKEVVENISEQNFNSDIGVILSEESDLENLQKEAAEKLANAQIDKLRAVSNLSDEDVALSDNYEEQARRKEYKKRIQAANSSPNQSFFDKAIQSSKFIKEIIFITLGDIINAAASFVDFRDEVRIILAPIKIQDKIYNICDIPISIRLFNIWFAENIIKVGKTSYFFWQFIQDIFKSLVHPNLLNNPIFGRPTLNLNFQITSITSDKKFENGKIYSIQENSDSVFNSLSPNVWHFTSDIYMYLIVYSYDYQIQKRDGIYHDDVKDGIYHYYRGTDRGIIKNINFSKVDFPRFRDMRIANDRYNNPGDILREHYNATLECIGNPLFAIGSHIYINATSIGKHGVEISRLLGLSGYYLVTSVEKIFTPDKYEEKIGTFWVFQETGTTIGPPSENFKSTNNTIKDNTMVG